MSQCHDIHRRRWSHHPRDIGRTDAGTRPHSRPNLQVYARLLGPASRLQKPTHSYRHPRSSGGNRGGGGGGVTSPTVTVIITSSKLETPLFVAVNLYAISMSVVTVGALNTGSRILASESDPPVPDTLVHKYVVRGTPFKTETAPFNCTELPDCTGISGPAVTITSVVP